MFHCRLAVISSPFLRTAGVSLREHLTGHLILFPACIVGPADQSVTLCRPSIADRLRSPAPRHAVSLHPFFEWMSDQQAVRTHDTDSSPRRRRQGSLFLSFSLFRIRRTISQSRESLPAEQNVRISDCMCVCVLVVHMACCWCSERHVTCFPDGDKIHRQYS